MYDFQQRIPATNLLQNAAKTPVPHSLNGRKGILHGVFQRMNPFYDILRHFLYFNGTFPLIYKRRRGIHQHLCWQQKCWRRDPSPCRNNATTPRSQSRASGLHVQFQDGEFRGLSDQAPLGCCRFQGGDAMRPRR